MPANPVRYADSDSPRSTFSQEAKGVPPFLAPIMEENPVGDGVDDDVRIRLSSSLDRPVMEDLVAKTTGATGRGMRSRDPSVGSYDEEKRQGFEHQIGMDGPSPTEKINAMTPEERILGLYDVHCVSEIIQEMPEFVAKKLDELEIALKSRRTPSPPSSSERKMPSSDNPTVFKSAYEQAKEKYPEYADAMKLRFLRAERFDIAKAAERWARYNEVKQVFFGDEALGRDLSVKDLTEDDRHYVKSGYVQVLSQRDPKGRAVVMLMGKMSAESPLETTLRILFLFCDALSARDEAVQKSGVVLVYYAIGQKRFSSDELWKWLDLGSALPIRVEAAHACYDDPSLAPMFEIASNLMSSNCLVRFRSHFGNDDECQSILKTFGITIQKENFPLKSDGSTRLYHLRTFLFEIGDEELLPLKGEDPDAATISSARSSSGALSSIASETTTAAALSEATQPGPDDIIMGRGRRGQKSNGNRRYHQLLRMYRAKYESANNFEKTLVAEFVLKLLREGGHRFLRPRAGGSTWIEVPDEVAREKISHAFRNLRETEPNG